jgi:tetratricopeptide (TPR) repeat protein
MKKSAVFWLLLMLFACAKNPADEAAVHRKRADEYMEAGNVLDASIEYQAALQKWPEDLDSLYGFAKTLEALGEYWEYRRAVAKILQVSPTHPDACVAMGEIQFASGRYEEALVLARRALEGAAGYPAATKLEARALFRLDRFEEARELWVKMLSGDSPDESLFSDVAEFESLVGNLERAVEILDQGLERYPDSVALRLPKAGLLLGEGNIDGAGAALVRALELEPGSPAVHAARAKYFFLKGEPEKAEQVLDAARERFLQDDEKTAAMVLRRAGLYLWLGALSRAHGVLAEEWERKPGNPQVAADLADILVVLGDTAQAMELLDHVRKADAYGRRARLIAARISLQQGQPERALRAVGGLVAKGDFGLDVHSLYARALTEVGKYAMARFEYSLILRRDPENHLARVDYCELLLQLRDYERALAELERLPEEIADSELAQYLKSLALTNSGDAASSKQILKEMLKKDPDNAALLKAMGDLERKSGRVSRAITYYDKAIESEPRNLDAIFAKSSVIYKDKKYPKGAMDVLDDYARKHGDNYEVLNYKASIWLAEGDPGSALSSIDRSLLIEPNAWQTRYMKAMIHLVEGDRPKAMVELQQAIDLSPARSLPYNALAEIQLGADKRDAAEGTYKALLEANPGDPLTANNLSNLYLADGMTEEALALAKTAHLGAPRDAHILDTLGWALELSGEHESARPFLEAAVAELSGDHNVLYHWGTNLQSRGQKAEARRVFEQVVELAPESLMARQAEEHLTE